MSFMASWLNYSHMIYPDVHMNEIAAHCHNVNITTYMCKISQTIVWISVHVPKILGITEYVQTVHVLPGFLLPSKGLQGYETNTDIATILKI